MLRHYAHQSGRPPITLNLWVHALVLTVDVRIVPAIAPDFVHRSPDSDELI